MDGMHREKDDWHVVVVTGKLQETYCSLLLKATISKFFREERILIDAYQQAFCSYSLQPETALMLIISLRSTEPVVWELLEKNLQRLEPNCKLFKLIYVGKAFSSLPTNLIDRILAYTPENSQGSLLVDKLFSLFPNHSQHVFCTTDGLQENGIKCFTAWEDISYILNEVKFLIGTPRESNIELLRALLVTTETDFLLLKNKQRVQVSDLQGKMLLLLITPINMSEIQISTLKDTYLKMLDRHDYPAEVFWIQRVDWGRPTWVEYERCATNSPWLVVPNPWLINPESLHHLVDTATALVVLDAKGMISCKDALPMIERWGLEAYPFCQSREDELRNLEWEGLRVQASVQFVFQNLQSSQLKIKKAMHHGETIFLCTGFLEKMLDFVPSLNFALMKLKIKGYVLYVGRRPIYIWMDAQEAANYEMKREAISNIPSLSFLDAHKLWQRIVHLYNDLRSIKDNEKTLKVRRLVSVLLNKANRDVELIVIGEDGEIVTGRGKEMVEVLLKGVKDEEELLCDIKSKGLKQVLYKKWKDDIVSNALYH